MTTLTLALLLLLFPADVLEKTFGPQTAIVITDVKTGETTRWNEVLCNEPLPPCSTFKIWNTAIGLESGVLKEANEPFYQWDGKKRWLEAWNRDLTLKEAYEVSSVPAYQALARKIGPERMNHWVKQLHYGDGDTSSGNDLFWLPQEKKKSLLITAERQAELLVALLKDGAGLSPRTLEVLREVMLLRKGEEGSLYAKTGSGLGDATRPAIGWYVGFVESRKGTFVFAAVTRRPFSKEQPPLGPEMRGRVEKLLEERGLLSPVAAP